MPVQIKRRIDVLRTAVESELNALEALLFWTCRLDQKHFDGIKHARDQNKSAPRKIVEKLRDRMKSSIDSVRSVYGAKNPNIEYIEPYQLVFNNLSSPFDFYQKKQWFDERFKYCDKIFPDFARTPRHALYAVPLPPQPSDASLSGYLLPEVTLYEDMATLFNEAISLHRSRRASR